MPQKKMFQRVFFFFEMNLKSKLWDGFELIVSPSQDLSSIRGKKKNSFLKNPHASDTIMAEIANLSRNVRSTDNLTRISTYIPIDIQEIALKPRISVQMSTPSGYLHGYQYRYPYRYPYNVIWYPCGYPYGCPC